MAGHERVGAAGSAGTFLAAMLTLCPLALLACASAPQAPPEEEAPPATSPQTMAPPPAPTPPTVEQPVPAPIRGSDPIVISEGKEELGSDQDLASAAAAERQRRRAAAPPALVITDKNLAEHATGKLTVSEGNVTLPEAPDAPAAQPSDGTKDEHYWRERVRGLREQWAASVDAIGELESRVNGLRTRFYAEDDPYVRDGEIKPAWDRSLENLASARLRARSFEEKLGQALEEGRQAGALPGWLRDGIELEPSERPYDPPGREVARDDANVVYEPDELGKPPDR